MDINGIAQAVAQAVQSSQRPTVPTSSLPTPFQNKDNLALLSKSLIRTPPELEKNVFAKLAIESECDLLKDGLVSTGDSVYRFTIETVGRWLIAQAMNCAAEKVVSKLAKLINENNSEVTITGAIAGLEVGSEIFLSKGWKLVPFDSVPPSYGRAMIRSRYYNNMAGFETLPKLSLLVCSESVRPVIRKVTGSEGLESEEHIRDLIESRKRQISAIQHCLTLIGPCSPSQVANWTQFDPDEVPVSGGGSSSGRPDLFARNFRALAPFDPSDAVALITAFLNLPVAFQDELKVPLGRLNSAISEWDMVDQVIDLGIALESLLLHEVGDPKTQGELSYRLRLNGAHLLGGSSDERAKTFTTLGKLYLLRSKAVHTGKLAPSSATRELLTQGEILCARLIRKVIQSGQWPDWNSLVLG